MKDWLHIVAAVITVGTFPFTLIQIIRGLSVDGLSAIPTFSVDLGSGIISIIVFLFFSFMFGLFFSQAVQYFSERDRIYFLVAHPIIGLVSGLQSIVFVFVVLGFSEGDMKFIGSLSVVTLLLILSLAIENCLIAKPFIEGSTSKGEDTGILAAGINTIFFSVAWLVVLIEGVGFEASFSGFWMCISTIVLPILGAAGSAGLYALLEEVN